MTSSQSGQRNRSVSGCQVFRLLTGLGLVLQSRAAAWLRPTFNFQLCRCFKIHRPGNFFPPVLVLGYKYPTHLHHISPTVISHLVSVTISILTQYPRHLQSHGRLVTNFSAPLTPDLQYFSQESNDI